MDLKKSGCEVTVEDAYSTTDSAATDFDHIKESFCEYSNLNLLSCSVEIYNKIVPTGMLISSNLNNAIVYKLSNFRSIL